MNAGEMDNNRCFKTSCFYVTFSLLLLAMAVRMVAVGFVLDVTSFPRTADYALLMCC